MKSRKHSMLTLIHISYPHSNRYRWDVTSKLQSGANSLVVAFVSAATYAVQQAAAYPYDVPAADDIPLQHGEPNRNFIRKEQCKSLWFIMRVV